MPHESRLRMKEIREWADLSHENSDSTSLAVPKCDDFVFENFLILSHYLFTVALTLPFLSQAFNCQ